MVRAAVILYSILTHRLSEQEKTRVIEVLETAMINGTLLMDSLRFSQPSSHLPLDNAILCITGASKASEKVLYEICMKACLEHGEVWVAGFDDEIHAVSFWIRPGADFHIG
jgi:hypothetical protein